MVIFPLLVCSGPTHRIQGYGEEMEWQRDETQVRHFPHPSVQPFTCLRPSSSLPGDIGTASVGPPAASLILFPFIFTHLLQFLKIHTFSYETSLFKAFCDPLMCKVKHKTLHRPSHSNQCTFSISILITPNFSHWTTLSFLNKSSVFVHSCNFPLIFTFITPMTKMYLFLKTNF